MKETIIKCDGCSTTEKVDQYRINMGKEMDPSGNGYNTIWEYKDFCWNCFRNYSFTADKILTKIEKL